MLLMVEKGIRGGICNPIYWYSKANNKYMKIVIKKDTSQFNEDFIENYNEENDERYFFEVLKNYINFKMIYDF